MTEGYQEYEKRLSLIFRILGSSAALRILSEAEKGFKSGRKIIKRLKLTPRKYYRYLRQMQNLGIIKCVVSSKSNEKKEHTYCLTPLGRNLYRLVFNDFPSLLDEKGKESFLKDLDDHSRIVIIGDYETLVKTLSNLFDQAKSQILIATRYVDFSVSQSLVQAVQRGVELKSVTDKRLNLPQFLKLIGGLLRNIRPNLLKHYLTNRGDYRIGTVPISFSLIDKEIVVFEVPTKEFRIAFVSDDKEVLKVFYNIFWKIWKNSQEIDLTPLKNSR